MKPELIEVLEIVMMKEEAKALYDEVDKRIATIKRECGAGRYDYDLNDLSGGDIDPLMFGKELQKEARYLKLEIVDNVAKLAEGESVWKSVGFKPISFSSK